MNKSHILIVDDDPAICESMQEFIEISGYACTTASNAEEALRILEKIDVDIMITDIILPGMSGLALTEKVKKDFDADIIVMTAYSGDYSYEEAVYKGASDFVFKPVRFEELLLRIKRVSRERELEKERLRMMEKLHELAITDGLTGLFNSRHFYEQVESEAGRALRYKKSLALLLLDIDYFKQYNDRFGHLEGDKVLVGIGKLILSCLRVNDAAFRYGGEEFAVLLPETGGKEAKKVADRIRDNIAKESFSPKPGESVTITISIGVTEYVPNEDITEFIRRSDEAMYDSKEKGRNRVSCRFAGS